MPGEVGAGSGGPDTVLVAVGPAPGSLDALLRFAVAEAQRRSCGVHVVHVVRPGTWAPVGGVALVEGELRNVGRVRVQAACVRLVAALGPDTAVSAELCPGLVVPTVVSRSGRAPLLVTGHDPAGPFGRRRPHRSVGTAVAARAPVPVVVVPDGWTEDPEDGRAGDAPVVVVGVDVTPDGALGASAVVGAALAEAARRGARLRLVHARRGSRGSQGSQGRGAEQVLALCDPVLRSCREVPVDVVVAPGQPVAALLAHSHGAAVTVVGRPRRRLRPASPLGPVAQGVLRRSALPTLVVPPADHDRPQGAASGRHAASPR